jgi:hypothetical protein
VSPKTSETTSNAYGKLGLAGHGLRARLAQEIVEGLTPAHQLLRG